jgi:hypothetical protein
MRKNPAENIITLLGKLPRVALTRQPAETYSSNILDQFSNIYLKTLKL